MVCKQCNSYKLSQQKLQKEKTMTIDSNSNLTSRLIEGDSVELKVIYYKNKWHLVAYYNGDKTDKEDLGVLG